MTASDAPLPEFLGDLLPSLIKLFDASTLSELELKYGDVHLALRRPAGLADVGAGALTTPAAQVGEPEDLESQGHVVTAQMVGTFYLTPAPGKPPMVREGELVEKGQVIGIIEAMKVMNELESDVSGRVTRIMVKNQQPVEYGQPLMVIAPE